MKKYFIIFILFISIIVVGCSSNKTEEIETVSNIELGKEQYIKQLKKVKINNTDDFIMIISKVTWSDENLEDGSTISSSLSIPYVIHVDGLNYTGNFILGSNVKNKDDDNPKYKVEITDVKKTYETKVLITNKEKTND